MIDPSVAHGCFQGLPESHELLMDGVMSRRFAVLGHRLFVAMNAVVLDLAGSNFRQAQLTEERHQVPLRAPLLAFHVDFAALALRDDVVFTKE